MDTVDLSKTFGALLIGALFASVLSGAVSIQTLLYYKMYPLDDTKVKLLVLLIWLLDNCHTGLIWAALWSYFIEWYGHPKHIDYIPESLALSVLFTAVLTFCVHSFFAHRIFKLSDGNLWLAAPIAFLSFLRLVCASASTGEMLKLQSFEGFIRVGGWIFTLGLSLSSAVDVLITLSLVLLLHTSRSRGGRLDAVIDTLILYAFETASVTSAATIVSMICWVTMSTNLVFMGLHFFIGKLYAISLLVTLNLKRDLRAKSRARYTFPSILLADTFTQRPQPISDPLSADLESAIPYKSNTQRMMMIPGEETKSPPEHNLTECHIASVEDPTPHSHSRSRSDTAHRIQPSYSTHFTHPTYPPHTLR